jgi:hypothetical protein
MSLVNEALKRAHEAQPSAPPPIAHQQFKPPEDSHRASLWAALLVPGVLLVAALMVLFMAWEMYMAHNRERASEARAREMTNKLQVATQAAADAPAVNPLAPSNTVWTTPAPAEPVPVSVPEPVKTQPSLEFKLQAIVYHPTRPSVIINGSSLFQGDKVGGWTVRSIDSQSVVLANATQTNTLLLSR